MNWEDWGARLRAQIGSVAADIICQLIQCMEWFRRNVSADAHHIVSLFGRMQLVASAVLPQWAV